ncbi:hypothetical protein LIER_01007 [Lithospermum erythrorhizon]|uniref:Uncharacterized protein n=1 Tax=Lithospermum erythrorhizon TaxID=34254 RepID=A0AAV3NKM1_LITER
MSGGRGSTEEPRPKEEERLGQDPGARYGILQGKPSMEQRLLGRQSGGRDSGSPRRAYAKKDIYVVTARARHEIPDLSFSKKYFERIECLMWIHWAQLEVGSSSKKPEEPRDPNECALLVPKESHEKG